MLLLDEEEKDPFFYKGKSMPFFIKGRGVSPLAAGCRALLYNEEKVSLRYKSEAGRFFKTTPGGDWGEFWQAQPTWPVRPAPQAPPARPAFSVEETHSLPFIKKELACLSSIRGRPLLYNEERDSPL